MLVLAKCSLPVRCDRKHAAEAVLAVMTVIPVRKLSFNTVIESRAEVIQCLSVSSSRFYSVNLCQKFNLDKII